MKDESVAMREDFFKPRLTFSCNYHFQMKITLTLLFPSFDGITRVCFPTLTSVSSYLYSFTRLFLFARLPTASPVHLLSLRSHLKGYSSGSFPLVFPDGTPFIEPFASSVATSSFLKIKLILFIYSSLAVLALHC